jgi:hypothetical protein
MSVCLFLSLSLSLSVCVCVCVCDGEMRAYACTHLYSHAWGGQMADDVGKAKAAAKAARAEKKAADDARTAVEGDLAGARAEVCDPPTPP